MTSSLVQRLALVSALGLLSACAIARPGPSESAITSTQTSELSGFTLIKVTAQNVAEYRVAPASDSAGTGGIPGAPRVMLNPGDVVRIHISESTAGGLFAPASTGGTTYDNVRVDGDGTITIPYAGKMRASGLTLPGLSERIRAKVTGVTFDPQVYAELIAGRGSSVLISGDVKNPGRISMLDGPSTIIDVINKAGGPAHPTHEEDVVVRRGNKVQRLPLDTIMNGNNGSLRAGDEITLVPHLKVFNALGTLNKTGQMEFPQPSINLQDAISIAGGLSDIKSSNKGVFVFRLHEKHAWLDADNKWREGPAIFQFDFSKPETMFLAQAFTVQPDDTVYVTVAPAIEWVKTLTPIAATLATIKSIQAEGTIANNSFSN
jgi:polysaccharide export outer membrane protein